MGLDKPGKPPYNEAVKDVEGKKDGNSRPQRAGGCCEPVGSPYDCSGVFRLNRFSRAGTGGPVTGRIVQIAEGWPGNRQLNQGGIAWQRP